jgi:ABC-type dipeptide/oligopeptide/nickel transport system permease subunit
MLSEPGLNSALVAIGIVYAPQFARVARAPTLSLRERASSRRRGPSGLRPLAVRRHILPNSRPDRGAATRSPDVAICLLCQ